MGVQNTDQFVYAALDKPFKSNCSWRKATGNHLHICTSHVYDDASAMTVSSRTCLRAENSSSSSTFAYFSVVIVIPFTCQPKWRWLICNHVQISEFVQAMLKYRSG